MNKYYVVYVPDGSKPECLEFENREQVLAWFVNLNNTNCHVFVFKGERLLFSGTGLFKYLTEGAEHFPLFKLSGPGEPVKESSLEELMNLDNTYAELTPLFALQKQTEEQINSEEQL